MSWMDSWSRPSKHQATPAPFYLLPGGEATPYCHSCGRVINSRRTGAAAAAAAAEDKGAATAVKYCSSRCRSHKPGRLDRKIEGVFAGLLDGIGGGEGDGQGAVGGVGGGGGGGGGPKGKGKGKGGNKTKKKVKGDARLLVSCDEVERYMFHRDGSDAATGSGSGTEDGHADEDEDAAAAAGSGSPPVLEPPRLPQQHLIHALHDDGTGTLEDPTGQTTTTSNNNNNNTNHAHTPIDYDVLARLSVRSGTRIRPPQSVSEVNGSVGGEKGRAERADETGEMLEKRREGLRRARQREMVRCAARRGVVFGFGGAGGGGGAEGEAGSRRKCEAVMSGKVVEPSFAKGDWSVRWRE